jgi:hypothetical protein
MLEERQRGDRIVGEVIGTKPDVQAPGSKQG